MIDTLATHETSENIDTYTPGCIIRLWYDTGYQPGLIIGRNDSTGFITVLFSDLMLFNLRLTMVLEDVGNPSSFLLNDKTA